MIGGIVALPDEPDEAERMPEGILGPTEFTEKPNVRLINIQIKNVMLTLIRETYLAVLDELDKDIRSQDCTNWVSNFSCILVLCMCTEMVQVTSDFRVINSLEEISESSNRLDKNGNSASREDSINVCRQLDERLISTATSSFHLIYRFIKRKNGSKLVQGFNPIRDGVDIISKANVGHDVELFAHRIRSLLNKHSKKPV